MAALRSVSIGYVFLPGSLVQPQWSFSSTLIPRGRSTRHAVIKCWIFSTSNSQLAWGIKENDLSSHRLASRCITTCFEISSPKTCGLPSAVVNAACLKRDRGFEPHSSLQVLTKLNVVGSLRDRQVACSASDCQRANFESCVWRALSSYSSHHPQEVLPVQFSL